MKAAGYLLLACCLGSLVRDGAVQESSTVSAGGAQHLHQLQQLQQVRPLKRPVLQLSRHKHLRHHHESHWGPYFEHEEEHNESSSAAALALAVRLGAAAHLDCRVAMLQDKTVTWLRRWPDRVRLLTVGLMTYSSDPRLQVSYQYPNNWRLLISPVRREDEGTYLCQVSTHPPRAQATNLTVLAPHMRLVDEQGRSVKDRYYKTGSSIELTCLVSAGQDQGGDTLQLTWHKDGHPLSPGHIAEPRELPAGQVFSQLVIHDARKSHTGAYSCSLSKHAFVVANVYVLNGETQAAVQQDSWNSGGTVLRPAGHFLQLLALFHAALAAL